MIFELILVYCLVGDPVECFEQRPALEPANQNMIGCMAVAQRAAADTVRLHPEWTFKRARCQWGKKGETKT